MKDSDRIRRVQQTHHGEQERRLYLLQEHRARHRVVLDRIRAVLNQSNVHHRLQCSLPFQVNEICRANPITLVQPLLLVVFQLELQVN